MFFTNPDGVVVITDTLATAMDGADSHTLTKCYSVPHLGLVIAGTGLANLSAAWRSKVFDEMLCRDIDMLAALATKGLVEIWSQVRADHELPDELTSTIYHFGQSPNGEYVGYAFRSKNGFVPERLENGFGVKPVPLAGQVTAPDTLEEMIELAEKLRSEQSTLPPDERIYIGAQLVLTHLQNGIIAQQTIHTFDDFETQWLEMNIRMRSL